MNWFDTINNYYKAGLYTIDQVKIFVVKNKITADQFEQITGQTYTV